jgi:hypothetical protein
MAMSATVFTEIKFWLLILLSVALPFAIYGVLLAKRAFSRNAVLVFGLALVFVAGLDVYLLKSLSAMARLTPSLVDDDLFLSEVSLALYLLPAMFGGIGINVMSDVLLRQFVEIEGELEKKRPDG